jgi:hypothetical protein
MTAMISKLALQMLRQNLDFARRINEIYERQMLKVTTLYWDGHSYRKCGDLRLDALNG